MLFRSHIAICFLKTISMGENYYTLTTIFNSYNYFPGSIEKKNPGQGQGLLSLLKQSLIIRLSLFYYYCSLKVIGILNGTLTALPLCLPGVILGNLLIILSASFSKFWSGPRILTFPILPSFWITNITLTLP